MKKKKGIWKDKTLINLDQTKSRYKLLKKKKGIWKDKAKKVNMDPTKSEFEILVQNNSKIILRTEPLQ